MSAIVNFNCIIDQLIDLVVGYCVWEVSNFMFPICASERFCEMALHLLAGRLPSAENGSGAFWRS